MSDDNPQSQGNDIIPMEILTAMFAEWNYGHGRSIIIIRSTSATISMISSCCLIRMIMKSQDCLSTTYHRLLLGMSVGDILFSLPLITFAAMAPTDLSYMVWNARGNQATCTTAGFFVTIGVYLTLFYSCSLNIYYLILIKYNKSESYIRKKIEPFLHGIPISLALIWSIIGIVNKIYNDGGTGSCLTATYNPPHCDGYEDGEVREGFTIPCGRGQGEVFYTISGIVVLLIPPVVIGVSLAMLYRHVSKQEKIMSRYGAGALLNTTSNQSASDQNRDRAFSRAVLNKAIAYSSSYFLTWLWHIGGAIMGLQGAEKIPLAYKYLWNIFGPLQGFFNLLIFMHPKVQAVKKSNGNDDISWPRAFVRAFWSGLVGRASNNTKNKNDHPALAGSVGQNNKTYATALSSNSVLNTGSTPHHIPPVTEASRAPLGSDDFHKNGNTSNADES